MNSRLTLTLGTLLVSSALAIACSSAKSDAGPTSGAGAGPVAGTPNGGDGPDSMAGQGSESGGSGSNVAGADSTGGASTNGGESSGGTDSAGSAGADSAGAAGVGGEGPAPTLIANPSFELGSLVGWKVVVTPSSAGKSVFAQYPVGDAKAVDGNYEVAFWNGTSAFTGALEQTITDLTPGKYQLKVYVAFGTGINTAYLYAINCGIANSHVDLPIADTVPTFTEFTVPDIDVTGSSCTIGLYTDMDLGDWLNADAFSFEPVPG